MFLGLEWNVILGLVLGVLLGVWSQRRQTLAIVPDPKNPKSGMIKSVSKRAVKKNKHWLAVKSEIAFGPQEFELPIVLMIGGNSEDEDEQWREETTLSIEESELIKAEIGFVFRFRKGMKLDLSLAEPRFNDPASPMSALVFGVIIEEVIWNSWLHRMVLPGVYLELEGPTENPDRDQLVAILKESKHAMEMRGFEVIEIYLAITCNLMQPIFGTNKIEGRYP